jgi:hypothetical protein
MGFVTCVQPGLCISNKRFICHYLPDFSGADSAAGIQLTTGGTLRRIREVNLARDVSRAAKDSMEYESGDSMRVRVCDKGVLQGKGSILR